MSGTQTKKPRFGGAFFGSDFDGDAGITALRCGIQRLCDITDTFRIMIASAQHPPDGCVQYGQ